MSLTFINYGIDEISNPRLRSLPKQKKHRFRMLRTAVGMRPKSVHA